jgi:hypothetical protein
MFMHIGGTMQPGYRRADADSQNLGAHSGAIEFPVAAACARAMLCRSPANRPRRIAETRVSLVSGKH